MLKKAFIKIKNNLYIYKFDLKERGLYYFLTARIIKVPVLKKIYNMIKPGIVKVGDYKLYIDKHDMVVSENLIQHGNWEAYETYIIKKIIKKGSVFIDIGAHIGYYTVAAAICTGKTGKVFAFEPDPHNFTFLKKNVAINNLKNVVLIDAAVGNKNYTDSLYINTENSGDNRLYNSDKKRKAVDVKVISLDNYFFNNRLYLNKIDIIKMDIQGSEYKALLGMKKLIMENKNIIIISEFWPMGLKNSGYSAKKYLDLITKSGFMIYEINENQKRIRFKKPDELLKKYSETEIEGTNIICSRSSFTFHN